MEVYSRTSNLEWLDPTKETPLNKIQLEIIKIK